MSVEIKYRIWNKKNKHWCFSSSVTAPNFQTFDLRAPRMLILPPKNCVIQRFTGLKDKNSVEIYEGDILKKYWKTKDKKTNKYIFNDNNFSPFVVKWSKQHCGFSISVGKSHYYEVIGNIFENFN